MMCPRNRVNSIDYLSRLVDTIDDAYAAALKDGMAGRLHISVA